MFGKILSQINFFSEIYFNWYLGLPGYIAWIKQVSKNDCSE